MDSRLLDYYNRELQFMREMGAEFAQQYPRIAARLGMDGLECADPYVERLLEGFALLAARVQLKIDARHPEFTEHLLEKVYPHFISPVPSCAIAEFIPDFKEDALHAGVRIPAGAALRTNLRKGQRTATEYRIAHEVVLWPLTVAEARYFSGTGALANLNVPAAACVESRAAIRLRLRTLGVPMSTLQVDELTFFIKATSDVAAKLYEQLLAQGVGVYVRGGDQGQVLPATAIRCKGFSATEALLPAAAHTFEGYRLLQEYFAFPERFLFFTVAGLLPTVQQCAAEEMDIYLLLNRTQPALENVLDASLFKLYCTPIINLFHKSLDRLHVGDHATEHHVIPDRNRSMDFEVFAIDRVAGVGGDGISQREIYPLYSSDHYHRQDAQACYYTVQRRPRLLSNRQQRTGERTSYMGSEVFITLVDTRAQALTHGFRQVDVQALCTNRDLPIQENFGKGRTDFIVDGSVPVDAIRCIVGPTAPRPSPAFGDTAWKLISHLSLNYLSLQQSTDTAHGDGVNLLRELLSLYADPHDAVMARQIEGVRHIAVQPCVERVPGGGPISYGRGLKVTLTLDDAAFEGLGVMVLGSVLEQFFARYVSINSFVQTELRSTQRGLIKIWPLRFGTRPTI